MTNSHCSQIDLRERIHGFVVAAENDELTSGHWMDFERVLSESDEACRLYAEYMDVSLSLSAILETMPDEHTTFPDDISGEPVDSLARPFLTLFQSTLAYFSDGMPLAYLLATVITGLGLLVMGLVRVSGPEEVARRAHTLPSPAERGAGGEGEVVGKITGAVSCQWREDSRASLGQKIDLPSGLLEITYNTGAKVILQGPVNYQVEANGGYLAVGKLTGKLEKRNNEARMTNDEGLQNSSLVIRHSSFVIHTPTATVTDLGTEFGVEVSKKGVTETRVFDGAVKIVASGGGIERASERIVRAGGAVRTDAAGRLRAVTSLGPLQFVRTLPSTPATRAEAYSKLVLSLKPIAYYPMDSWPDGPNADTRIVVDSAPGGHHGLLHHDRAFWPDCVGRFGRALDLHGEGTGDYAAVKNVPPSTTQQLSFSAWIYCIAASCWDTVASQYNTEADVTDWDGHDDWQFYFSLRHTDHDLNVHVNQRNKIHIELREGASHPLPANQWQYVAFVADGSTLHLYRNGREVASAPCDGVYPCRAITYMTIGCKDMRPSASLTSIRPLLFWTGLIDELAIFDHALSPDDIRRLFSGKE
jgi:hypothetical protein